jgi:hypothetical protein
VSETPTALPAAVPAPPRRRALGPILLGLAGLAAAAAGAYLALRPGVDRVDAIRVTRQSMLPASLMGTPDYYVNVVTADGTTIPTPAYVDTPIGNGLDFKLPEPLDLAAVAHIELLDEDVGSDDTLDRVDVRGRLCKGQEYAFELLGPTPPSRTAGYVALGCGAGLLLIAAIWLARAYAI